MKVKKIPLTKKDDYRVTTGKFQTRETLEQQVIDMTLRKGFRPVDVARQCHISVSTVSKIMKRYEQVDARRRLCEGLASIRKTIFANKDLFLAHFFNVQGNRSGITCVYFSDSSCYVQFNDDDLVDHQEWLNIWLVFEWIDSLPESHTTGEGS